MSDWKIVDTNLWCRHKIGNKCVYFSKDDHKCVKDKCPIEYNSYINKRNKPIGG